MYQVGELVVYGIHGVCRVSALEERIVDRKTVTYLALEQENQDTARYLVPTHNAAAMGKVSRILEPEQLKQLLSSDSIRTDGWIKEENLRKQTYRTLIGSGDREKLVQMLHTLYRRRKKQSDTGRKFHQCDENFLRDAEKLLSGEVAVVLGMTAQEAKAYIREHLK